MIGSSTWIKHLVLRTVRAADIEDPVFAMEESFFRKSGSHLATLTNIMPPAKTGNRRLAPQSSISLPHIGRSTSPGRAWLTNRLVSDCGSIDSLSTTVMTAFRNP